MGTKKRSPLDLQNMKFYSFEFHRVASMYNNPRIPRHILMSRQWFSHTYAMLQYMEWFEKCDVALKELYLVDNRYNVKFKTCVNQEVTLLQKHSHRLTRIDTFCAKRYWRCHRRNGVSETFGFGVGIGKCLIQMQILTTCIWKSCPEPHIRFTTIILKIA